jgi:hypothetical protein
VIVEALVEAMPDVEVIMPGVQSEVSHA